MGLPKNGSTAGRWGRRLGKRQRACIRKCIVFPWKSCIKWGGGLGEMTPRACRHPFSKGEQDRTTGMGWWGCMPGSLPPPFCWLTLLAMQSVTGCVKQLFLEIGFNVVFSHLLGLDLSTGVVRGVLERSSHCPLPCPTRAGRAASGYWPWSVGCCRCGERGALPQGSSDPLLPGQEW